VNSKALERLTALPPSWAHAVEENFVGYTQPCLRVVSWWSVDIPLGVWGLCFGKVGGVIYCLVGPVWGYRRSWPQCPLIHPCLQYLCCSCLCARVSLLSGVIILYYLVSSEFKYALSNYPSPPGGHAPLDHDSGLPGLMTPGCPQSTWSFCCSSLNCSACG
jgi:hypothetical protein